MRQIPKVVLLIESTGSYGRQLLRGIAKYARLNNPWIFYRENPAPYYKPVTVKKQLIERLKKWGVNGIITRDTLNIDQIISMKLPTIVLAGLKKSFHGLPVIDNDPAEIAKIAAQYLIERRFVNFAYCGYDNMHWSRDRCRYFCEILKKQRLKVHVYKQPSSHTKRSWEVEQIIMADWLRSLPKPLALLTCNDDRGEQALEACQIADIHIPEQIAVLGIGNDDIVCELSNPRLSSIAFNGENAGYEAAQLLDQMMSGLKVRKKIIPIVPSHVVTRLSTDILATEDRNVTASVQFIRQNARKNIQVSDVADVAGISRRTLERKFQSAIGRSILKEIKHIRVELMQQMLVETNLSVSQIAESFGFANIDNISRYFKSQTGLSPVQWRKKFGNK